MSGEAGSADIFVNFYVLLILSGDNRKIREKTFRFLYHFPMEQKVGDKYSWISLSNSHKSGYYLQDIKTYAPHSTWNDRTTTCTSSGCVKTVYVHIKFRKACHSNALHLHATLKIVNSLKIDVLNMPSMKTTSK